MEKKSYRFNTFFTEVVFGWKCIDTTDGELYFNGDDVWKVFSSTFPMYRKNEANIERVAMLDPKMFTIPLAKLYLEDEYYGFKMKNAGNNFLEYIKMNNPSMKEKIYLLNVVKNILNYINRQEILHGDVRLQNIMVDKDELNRPIVRLGDVNNMIFPSTENCYLNALHSYWMNYYGTIDYVDKLAFDLFSHVVLNFNNKDIVDIASEPILIEEARMLFSEGNRQFDDEAFESAKHDIMCVTKEKRRMLSDTYLIDCLK